MGPSNVQTRLDDIAASLFKGSSGEVSDGDSGDNFLSNLKGILGDTFNDENLRNLGNQIQSTFNEHINEENLNKFGEKIKIMFNDNVNQEKINEVLEFAKGKINSDDKTGKAADFIQCLQNDINDPKCFEFDGASDQANAQSTAFSIQVQIVFNNFSCNAILRNLYSCNLKTLCCLKTLLFRFFRDPLF